VAIGVGVVIASPGVSSGAMPVLRPLVRGNVFAVFNAKFFRLRGLRVAGAVGDSLRSFDSDPGCFGTANDVGVSGEVPGVSEYADARGNDDPVTGDVSAELESVVTVEILPRCPPT